MSKHDGVKLGTEDQAVLHPALFHRHEGGAHLGVDVKAQALRGVGDIRGADRWRRRRLYLRWCVASLGGGSLECGFGESKLGEQVGVGVVGGFHSPSERGDTWLDAGWATACLGFTQKVEISQSLSDALHDVDEDERDPRLYGALWLAHHHLVLDQRPSFSFTFDFLREDKLHGRYVEHSLRLHVEESDQLILLGLLQDFPTQSNQHPKE